ncbi:hypothetical protein BDM02DRAFT_3110629 [Thelephora ganbajun]|uniref:Uncharacterized protein n=1 Tax=Thelephora ganbajun TaxID=370292 RepID=A0ACB6ZPZ3_THEGA|nr:hypothetical protein BDM02DRAFT_3110629 [Thelephora ganbajun]
MDLSTLLATVLQGTVKLMITQCCIHELYLRGKAIQSVVDLAKSFERRRCNHREAIPGDACLKDVIGETNKHRYVVATQSHPLRLSLRDIPAVPIVHVNRSVMILEPPSDVTLKAKEKADEAALSPAKSELVKLPTSAQQPEPPKKKRRGPKGPNPLSVKKKKPVVSQPDQPNLVTDHTPLGTKRKREDEQGGVEASAETSQAPGGGHKRKRRRKTKTEPSTDHNAS